MCVCECACECVRVRVCVHVCVHASSTCVMSVLASPKSPMTILTGSISTSRQSLSTFLRNVALNKRARKTHTERVFDFPF